MTKIKPNSMIAGDCVKILSGLDEPIAELIFADPPFNIGYKYDVYKDRKNTTSITSGRSSGCGSAPKRPLSRRDRSGSPSATIMQPRFASSVTRWACTCETGSSGITLSDRAPGANSPAATRTCSNFVKDRSNSHLTIWPCGSPQPARRPTPISGPTRRARFPTMYGVFLAFAGLLMSVSGGIPARMPEKVLERIVGVSSDEGDLVIDPFSGSGTTCTAAAVLGRRYLGIDISKKYVSGIHKAHRRDARGNEAGDCYRGESRNAQASKAGKKRQGKPKAGSRLCGKAEFSPEIFLAASAADVRHP